MRVARIADAGRRAGNDKVARLQGHAEREFGNQFGNRKGHLGHRRVLHQFAVDQALQADLVRVDLVGGHQERAQRHGAVDALALQPLPAVAPLQVALRNVVGQAIAPHMLHGACRGNAAAVGADDQREFGLVVPPGRNAGVKRDVVARADQRVRALGEERRRLGARHVLPLAPAFAFQEVVPVVPANAEHVAPQPVQRRQQVQRAEREARQPAVAQRGGDAAQRGRAARDHIAQVPHWHG
ncbi:hypothetical protein D3C72_1589500 [compost metagenome]